MSFDIFFQPCRYDGEGELRENPFTGRPESVPRNAPLLPAEQDAVRGLLATVCGRGPDAHGCWLVELGDGGSAEVFGSELREGCMVALRGMTRELLQLLFDLLAAGNWVMMPPQETFVAIATSKQAVQGVPEGFPEVVVCRTVDELGVLLDDGLEAWREYRDTAVRRKRSRLRAI